MDAGANETEFRPGAGIWTRGPGKDDSLGVEPRCSANNAAVPDLRISLDYKHSSLGGYLLRRGMPERVSAKPVCPHDGPAHTVLGEGHDTARPMRKVWPLLL